jgi:thioredoxin reductase (NADPH)
MIEVYSKDNCSYCISAIGFLNTAGLKYKEHKLGVHYTKEMLLEKFPAARTFPVIVVDGMYIGGYNELKKLREDTQNQADNRLFLTE